jgi:general secretion pathway protein D
VALAGGGVSGGGGQGGGGGGGGIRSVTRTNLTETVQLLAARFFTTLGVDLTPPKSMFFNDREGSLFVRANLQDLDTIERALQVLNIAPPQVNIKTKFIEVSQNDSKALGFDWYLGNFLAANGATVLSGGTQPTFQGSPSGANPSGNFPGNALAGTALAPSLTDQLLSGGIRQSVNVGNTPLVSPAVATFTGILTDPQFRVVLHAMEQRDGTDELNESSVTTLSGRQTEIEVVDLITIVTGNNAGSSAGAATSSPTTGTVVSAVPTINYTTEILPFGPTLDVIPYVSADGFTIQMTIIPTITEFLGYDVESQFANSVGAGGASIVAQLPLPHFRLRQVTTSAIVWDGQTVVLGGLITENVSKLKDKIPVLGDLPLIGRLFRSELSSTQKKNLIIFVTPTIIDPAGNRFHSEDEMPFAQNAIPPQRPLAP